MNMRRRSFLQRAAAAATFVVGVGGCKDFANDDAPPSPTPQPITKPAWTDKLLEHVTGTKEISIRAVYVGLSTADDKEGFGKGYSRQLATFEHGGNLVMCNVNEIKFVAQSAWGKISSFRVYDQAGNELLVAPLSVIVNVNTDDTLIISPGRIEITLE